MTFSRFEEICKRYPDNVALVFLGKKFTYFQLKGLIDRFATALWELGVGYQDKVMLYISNSPQWVIANFAIQKIGAVVVPVSPIYTSTELRYMVEDAGVKTIICHDTNFGYVEAVDKDVHFKNIIVTNIVDLLPFYKKVIGFLFDRIPRGKVVEKENVRFFKRLLSKYRPYPPKVTIDPWKDLAYIMYTGGTTGFPKGVPGTHMTEVSYIADIMDLFKDHVEEGKDKLIMVNPLFHIMAKGFFIALGLNFGNTTILMPFPQIDAILREIERHKVKWMLGVPALYRMILENDRLDRYNLRSLKYCYCGGDVLPTEIFKRWIEVTGSPIYQVYGSTEVGHLTYSRPDKFPSPKTVGYVLPSREILIVDPQTLKPVKEGEVGELLVYSKYTPNQYWNKPDETKKAYVVIDGKVYYRMGDFVRLNENGEIEFVERTVDTIKYKGYRVSASEIEAVLQDHPAVMEACVVGIPDERVGERIKAIVVLKEDAKGVDGRDLIKWCKIHLAPYKIPHYVEFRDMLPKSKVGKLLRKEVREEEKRKTQAVMK